MLWLFGNFARKNCISKMELYMPAIVCGDLVWRLLEITCQTAMHNCKSSRAECIRWFMCWRKVCRWFIHEIFDSASMLGQHSRIAFANVERIELEAPKRWFMHTKAAFVACIMSVERASTLSTRLSAQTNVTQTTCTAQLHTAHTHTQSQIFDWHWMRQYINAQ